MYPINFDLAFATAVWTLFTTVRGLIPAKVVSIDGKWTVWAGVLVLAAIPLSVYQLHGAYPSDVNGWAGVLERAFLGSVLAVIIDGGAAYSGIKDQVRLLVTLGGRTNAVSANAGAELDQALQGPADADIPLPPQPRTPTDLADEVEALASAYGRIQGVIATPPAGVAPVGAVALPPAGAPLAAAPPP